MADMMLLYDAAVLAAAIKGMYARTKDYPTARFFVYVLLLQEGKLYVGTTDNPYVRFGQHFACSPESAAWVREYGPPIRVVEMCENCRPEDEHYKFTEYADKFGYQNIRGGGCCRVIMNQEPPTVKSYRRRPDSDFTYLTRSEIDDIVDKVKSIKQT
jgi:hypothetical protein